MDGIHLEYFGVNQITKQHCDTVSNFVCLKTPSPERIIGLGP